jgi:hypothetical protein
VIIKEPIYNIVVMICLTCLTFCCFIAGFQEKCYLYWQKKKVSSFLDLLLNREFYKYFLGILSFKSVSVHLREVWTAESGCHFALFLFFLVRWMGTLKFHFMFWALKPAPGYIALVNSNMIEVILYYTKFISKE